MANYLTGLVLHELALPSPVFDPVHQLCIFIDALDWSGP